MEVAVEEEMVGGFHSTISEAQLLQLSAKGKRTKRPRSSVQSLNVVQAALTSSSSSDIDQYRLLPSPATTATSAENTTDEDEDMANCLILLARSGGGGGGGGGQYIYGADDQKEMRVIRRRKIRSSSGIIGTTTTTSNYSKRATGSGSSEVYECKTCNRCFPSFQALGGHRASHKKPKPSPVPINGGGLEKEIIKMAAEDVTVATTSIDHLQELEASHDGGFDLFKEITSTTLPTTTTSNMITMMTSMMPPTPPAVLKSMMIIAPPSSNSNKNKVHECAICGSEFNSGQALGGHMRRHRIVPELPNSKNVVIVNKASKINIDTYNTTTNSSTFTLDLDLNLPAPDELADHDLSSDFAVTADHEFADASTSTSEGPPEFGNKLIMTQEKNIGFKSKQPLLFTPLVDCHN